MWGCFWDLVVRMPQGTVKLSAMIFSQEASLKGSSEDRMGCLVWKVGILYTNYF